jgi:fatty acid desaturase
MNADHDPRLPGTGSIQFSEAKESGLASRWMDGRHLTRLGMFLVLYTGSAAGAWWLASHFPRGMGWILAVPLYVLAAASLHGISLFTHEAVHGTLSLNRWINGGLGALCAWPVLQNYSAYRILHLRHHDHLGAEGDPDHYPNYTRWSWMVFLMNWGRLLVGYPAYIVAIPWLAFRAGGRRERMKILAEVAGGALVIVALFQLPASLAMHGWLIPMLVINTFVNIRGMSQHTLLEADHGDTIRGTRTILTNPVTAFFMCNENYHLEHHLHPGVPWYHLPRLHRRLEGELRAQGAHYIPSYFSFVREFVAGSFRRSPLGSRAAKEFRE